MSAGCRPTPGSRLFLHYGRCRGMTATLEHKAGVFLVNTVLTMMGSEETYFEMRLRKDL